MFGAISDRNIHALARSAIGLYASQIPTTLLMLSYYSFIMSMVLLFYKIVPANSYAVALTVLAGGERTNDVFCVYLTLTLRPLAVAFSSQS